jgi:cysteine peptidase B
MHTLLLVIIIIVLIILAIMIFRWSETTPSPQPTTAAPQPTTAAPQPTTVAPQPTTVAPQPTTVAPQPTNLPPLTTAVTNQLQLLGITQEQILQNTITIQQNLKIIEEENKKQRESEMKDRNLPQTNYAANPFIIYPRAEFLRLFTGVIYPKGVPKSTPPSEYQLKTFTGTPPEQVRWDTTDNRVGKNCMLPIGNQGTCGSCWAWSANVVMEAAINIAGGNAEGISVNHALNCVKDCGKCQGACLGCQGGFPAYVYTYATNSKGAQSTAVNPYLSKTEVACDLINIKFDIIKGIGFRPDMKCVEVSPIGMNNFCEYRTTDLYIPTEEQTVIIQHMLNEYGPFTICVNADSLTFLAKPYNISLPGGVINHAVVLIGYVQRADVSGKNSLYWVIQNSWGKTWGDKGVFYAQVKTSYIAAPESVVIKL